jgi:TP901 family phage tail tape measure protein
MAEQNLKINITGDSSKLKNALSSASSKLSSFGSKMQSVGSQLQTRLALPLALAGGAAVKMAMDFDKSMTQIKSLVGIAGKEVDKMGESARKMALITGKSSSEAAEALFFITSAGLRGKEAMDVLEMSLKGAAVGLGQTKTIADLSTSAMNAYGSESLSASDATDILTAAVREGKLEASALAGAMGGVIPLASNMGVSFDQVGAAMAAMSKTGTDAATGATQLTAILASLKKPSAQAVDALDAMGMSTQFVQQSLREKGLLDTLVMLQEGLKKTGQDTTALFPNIRALKGVLDLTGASAEENKKVFDALSKSMGATQNAFDETSKSASFKFQQSLNAAKETLTSLGQQLLVAVIPLVQKLSNFVRNLYSAFRDLSPVTQKVIIGFGIFATALPTLIGLFGTLTTIVGALLSPLGLIAGALAAVSYIIYKNWNEILPVITNLYNQFVDLYNSSAKLRVLIYGIGAAFKSVFDIAKLYVDNFVSSFSTMWKLIKEASEKGFSGSFGDIIKSGFDEQVENIKNTGKGLGENFSDAFNDGIKSKLEEKTTEQIQNGLSNAVNGVQGYVNSLGAKVRGFFNDGLFQGGGLGDAASGVSSQTDNGPSTVERGGVGIQSLATPMSDMIEADTARIPEVMREQQAVLAENRLLALQQTAQFNERVGQVISGGLQNLASGMAAALGNAISSGGNLAGKLSNVILGSIGSMAMQLGKLAIGIGITLKKIKVAFKSLAPGVAIAAGVALVALGSFFKGKAASIGGGGGGGGRRGGGGSGSSYTGGNPAGGATAFANGGIISGPTMGLVGEYPGARQNPEVIAPLNKLQSIIGKSRNGGNINVSGEVRVDGQDLLIAIERANETAGRVY